MVTKKDKNAQRLKRLIRVRGKISGTTERPRLAVYRSNKNKPSLLSQIEELKKYGINTTAELPVIDNTEEVITNG